jgi:hypothetical protein
MIKNWLINLFKGKKIKQLEEQNELLKKKLEEKQEVINQTNAYWKKRLYNSNKKKNKES